MSVKTTWIIGGRQDNDLVVDLPSVSGRHCRLSRRPDGTFTVEDLGSTNGTFVNGRRIDTETLLRPDDSVTLGVSVPMPWPAVLAESPAPAQGPVPAGVRVVRVGREPDNDLVIDSPEVSSHHARVVISPGVAEGFIEDLGSTNGTAVGAANLRVNRATITRGDVVFFGPIAVPASTFFPPVQVASGLDSVPELLFEGSVMTVGRDPACDRVMDFPVVSGRHARFVRTNEAVLIEDLGSSNGTFVNGRRIEATSTVVPGDLIGLGSHVVRLVDGLARVDSGFGPAETLPSTTSELEWAPEPAAVSVPFATPAVATLYVLAAGFGLGVQAVVLAGLIHATGRVSNASALFGLSLASIWVGLTAAFFERFLDAVSSKSRTVIDSGPADLASSLARAALVALCYSIVLMGLVTLYVPGPGNWPAAWGLIGLTVLLGAAMGLAVVRVSGRRAVGIPVAVGLIVVMGLLCVPLRPLPKLGPVGRLAAGALPTRWSFEGLFLLSAGDRADEPGADPVEPYFPAATDRSGTLACATALLAMLGGVVYADAVIALTGAGRPHPAGPASR